MAIPAQARAAGDAANRRIAELAGQGAPPAPPADPNNPSPDPNTAPALAPADSAPPVAANPPADPNPAPAPTAPPANDDASWQQRYNTLQGMFNASQRQAQADIQALRQQIDNLTGLLAQAPPQGPAAAPAPAVDPEATITDQHRQEYGDAIDMMQRAARHVMQPLIARLSKVESVLDNINQQVVPTVQSVAQAQALTAEDMFFRDLQAQIPNWRDINNNPDFQAWLLQVEPLVGVYRQTILEDAQRRGDVDRVALLFKTWPGFQGTAAPAPANPTPNNAPAALQAQIAPGRGKAPAPPQPGQPKVYTRAEIAAFFDDVRAQRYVGREAEKARLEADIFAASREGRIQD